MNNLKKLVLNELQNINFPTCHTRKNIGVCKAFCLGTVPYRGQSYLNGKMKGPGQYNSKFPELFKALKALIAARDPDFTWTTIQVNKNVVSPPHIDQNNVGPSYIIALGDFEGGELVIEGKAYNIRNRWKKFDGRKGHWIKPFRGERYSLVFFTHTFKPPMFKDITVKKNGLYKNGVLLKSYKK